MPEKIDFADLKQTVPIERAAEWLGLQLKKTGGQLRGPCPVSQLQNDFERQSNGANVCRIKSTIFKCHNLIYIALHCRCRQ